MRIGYARTSIGDKDRVIQYKALADAGCEAIYADEILTGPKPWPDLDMLLKRLDPSQTLVICRLDRIATGLEDLAFTLDQIQLSGVGFWSISEDFALPIGPKTYVNGLMKASDRASAYVKAVKAFLEQVHLEKTKIGHAKARERGTRIGGGRPKLDQDQIDLLLTMFATQGQTNREICRMFGIHETTLYRYVHLHRSPEESSEWASEST